MTPAQQYHERKRDEWLSDARMWKEYPWDLMKRRQRVEETVRKARHHNHQAIHVARLTRARQAQP